jgi:GTP cyclohydrolase IA
MDPKDASPGSPAQLAAEGSPDLTAASTEALIRELLLRLGEDPTREGLLKTPERVRKSLQWLTSGNTLRPATVVGEALFHEATSGTVVVRNIEFYSMCEHHLLPFFGKVHIAYEPDGRIIGLSKLPRIVDVFARRLQVQERLTAQIADLLMDRLQPRGTIVVLECEHMCMAMRGVQKGGSRTVTSAVRGMLRDDAKSRAEAMSLIIRG